MSLIKRRDILAVRRDRPPVPDRPREALQLPQVPRPVTVSPRLAPLQDRVQQGAQNHRRRKRLAGSHQCIGNRRQPMPRDAVHTVAEPNDVLGCLGSTHAVHKEDRVAQQELRRLVAAR